MDYFNKKVDEVQKELETALIYKYPDLYVELVPEFDI